MKVAMLTPAPDYAADFSWAYDNQAAALRAAGAEVSPIPWTEIRDAAGFDLILSLVAWGYHLRHAQWLAFLDAAEAANLPLVNPPALLRWNSDKAYLAELTQAGVPTVPTLAVDHLNEAALSAAHGVLQSPQLVVKPPVSAGAWGTFRLGPGEPVPDEVHGRRMLIQPWLPAVQEEGEYSLILFGGQFSHCVVKRPRAGDFRVQPEHHGTTQACALPDGALAVAEAALAIAPTPAAYARIDLIRGAEDVLQVMELELIEPALFLDCSPGAAERFAKAMLAAGC